MKKFLVFVFLVFLASCGGNSQPIDTASDSLNIVTEIDQNIETLPEIDASDIPDSEEILDDLIQEAIESEVPEVQDLEETIELSTTYQNPKIEVVMNIEYSLDENDTISEIEVTSPNYKGIPEFNEKVQGVIGLSVEEASEYIVSGSSLTTPAFQKALKDTL